MAWKLTLCYCLRCKLEHYDKVPDNFDGRYRFLRRKKALDQRLPVVECDECLRRRVGEANAALFKERMRGA